MQALRAGQIEDDALKQAQVLLRTGTSPEVLVRRAVGVAPSYDAIASIMSSLEELSSRDMELSLKLMTGLYPVASDVFAHDVCDSIELWLEQEGTLGGGTSLRLCSPPSRAMGPKKRRGPGFNCSASPEFERTPTASATYPSLHRQQESRQPWSA